MDIFEYVPFLEDSDWLTKLKLKSSNEWHLFSDQNSCTTYLQMKTCNMQDFAKEINSL